MEDGGMYWSRGLSACERLCIWVSQCARVCVYLGGWSLVGISRVSDCFNL